MASSEARIKERVEQSEETNVQGILDNALSALFTGKRNLLSRLGKTRNAVRSQGGRISSLGGEGNGSEGNDGGGGFGCGSQVSLL